MREGGNPRFFHIVGFSMSGDTRMNDEYDRVRKITINNIFLKNKKYKKYIYKFCGLFGIFLLGSPSNFSYDYLTYLNSLMQLQKILHYYEFGFA